MNSYDITLQTRDGQQLSFPCAADEDLLSAAERENILLPSQCRNGSCGACVAKVTQGLYQLEESSTEALPEAAKSEGQMLLCRTYPQADLHIQTPYDYEFIRFERIPERAAEIANLDTIASDTQRLLLAFLPDEEKGQAAEFEPGQYLEIQVPGTEARRAYSLANNTNWDGHLEMIIRHRDGGLFSGYLSNAKPGERLWVRGPLGTFTLRENGLRPRWFIGGGTGVVPLISMLRRMADWGEAHPARLYFGVRHSEELFFTEIIEELQQQLPQLRVKLCVSRPKAHEHNYAGNVVETLKGDLAAMTASPDCYICGSARLVQGVTETALDHGVPVAQIYSERFIPA